MSGASVTVKGPKGTLSHQVHEAVEISLADEQVCFSAKPAAVNGVALAGTTRSVVNNMVVGVSTGFERKLNLVGVGYRAQMKGDVLSLALGFSHPVDLPVPDGITIETPSQTEVIVKGVDKQRVGQTAAVIRSYRPPEPYMARASSTLMRSLFARKRRRSRKR